MLNKEFHTEEVKKTEEMTDDVKVKKNEVKSKTIELEPELKIRYKFDDVVSEQNAELNFKAFDFTMFKNMHTDILWAEKPYHDVKNQEGIYSKQYIKDIRDEAFANIVGIKMDYLGKAKDEIKKLKNPSIQLPTLSPTDEQINMLKRLNNSIIASELMRTLSVEELDDLYEQNKNNAEIRLMIKSRAFHLYRQVKDSRVKDKALHLKAKIQGYENELQNPDFFKELDMIEVNLDFILSKSDMYPTNLENGFSGINYRKFFS